jgi:Fic family protein
MADLLAVSVEQWYCFLMDQTENSSPPVGIGVVILQDPSQITLSGPSQELLLQVSSALDRIRPYRPFPRELDERLRATLLPDRIVASLNMEGIVATRRQTLAVMDSMRISEAVGRGEIEIRNALMADEFVHEAALKDISLNESFLREVNRLLLTEIRTDAGAFRSGPVELPGAPFQPPPPGDVPSLAAQLCQLFAQSESAHPVLQAAWLHAQSTLIHPFSDGNGRGGRILQDWALMRKGFLPVGIPPSKRDDYYAALADADQGNWDDLVELIALLELSIISRVEAIVDEQQHRASWVKQLSTAASRKHQNSSHKQYLVWRKRMEVINQSFKQAALELDESSDLIGATFKDYGVLELRDWEHICKHGWIEKSWLFSILFFAEGSPFYKTIGYLKRHIPLAIDTFSAPKVPPVALYFTGTTAPTGTRPNFADYEDPHIHLREIVFLDDHQFIYRQPDPDKDWEIQEKASVAPVVEEFFMDLFQRKAGLGA